MEESSRRHVRQLEGSTQRDVCIAVTMVTCWRVGRADSVQSTGLGKEFNLLAKRVTNTSFVLPFCRSGMRRHYHWITELLQSTVGTKWRLQILPQYHASLAKPIKYKESYIFVIFVNVLTTMCMPSLNKATWHSVFFMRFSERCFSSLNVMGKFTAAIYFSTEGLTLSDQNFKLQDRKLVWIEVESCRMRCSTHQILQLTMENIISDVFFFFRLVETRFFPPHWILEEFSTKRH